MGWMPESGRLPGVGKGNPLQYSCLENSMDKGAWWYEEPTHWERPWCWERLKAGGERDDRKWDNWMASPTQWTWVWVNSRRWWRTRKPGVLQPMGSQRVGRWATEQQKQKSQSQLNNGAQHTPLIACWCILNTQYRRSIMRLLFRFPSL